MKSTGEVMGIDADFGVAFYKAQLAAGLRLPTQGSVFVSVNGRDKGNIVPIARKFEKLGFELVATRGTATVLSACGVKVREIPKVSEGRPNYVDAIRNGQIAMVINTPLGRASYFDEKALRTTATQRGIPLITTLSGGHAIVEAIRSLKRGALTVKSLQEIYPAPQ